MSLVANSLRATARRAVTTPSSRAFSSSVRRTDFTRQSASAPISDTLRHVAQRAQEGVTVHATIEGFKAGVVYTLLGGSVLAAGYTILSSSEKEMRERELL